MFNWPRFFGFRGRSLNLAISSLGSLDFLYVISGISSFNYIPLQLTSHQQGYSVMTKV